jgi:hypothetical protein
MTQDEFDQFSVEQWNKLKPSEKRSLKKQGIENFQAYKRYLERNRKRGSLLDGSSGATPQLSDNPLQLDPNTIKRKSLKRSTSCGLMNLESSTRSTTVFLMKI